MALSQRNTWVVSAIALAAGLVGMFVALAAWHLNQDHNLLHELIKLEIQRAQVKPEVK